MLDDEDTDGDDLAASVRPEVPDSTAEVPDVTPEIPDASAASPALERTFWSLVAVFNVALLATALGLMLVGFEGRLRDGAALVALGLAAFALGLWRYRNRPREF